MTPTKEEEAKTLAELRDCLEALKIYQKVLPGMMTPSEEAEAEDRRCVLKVTGMVHHPDQVLWFRVVGGLIQLCKPLDSWNTMIEAPLDVVIGVLSGVTSGDEHAFANARAKQGARIFGDHRFHDFTVFRDAFRRLARGIKKYLEAVA